MGLADPSLDSAGPAARLDTCNISVLGPTPPRLQDPQTHPRETVQGAHVDGTAQALTTSPPPPPTPTTTSQAIEVNKKRKHSFWNAVL
ncbi:UNVERIFIED_CONTAM: hypothetical protein FKN15_036606 [Acipenser sinensis]